MQLRHLGFGRCLLFSALVLSIFNQCFGQFNLFHSKLTTSEHTTASRIFGGEVAREGQFPYMVLVLYLTQSGELSRCSASLVAWDKVLLAAHCFKGETQINPNNVLAVTGKAGVRKYIEARVQKDFFDPIDENALGVQERRARSVKIMPDFKECHSTCNHDLAVIEVNKPFKSSDTVQVVSIAPEPITQRTTCTILGWGYQEKNQDSLQLVYAENTHAVPLSECKHKTVGQFYCLQSRTQGICQGDSGSPLVCNGVVYGVASHTLSRGTNPKCGDDMEEYYAEIATDFYWLQPLIETNTNVNVEDDPPGGSATELLTSFKILFLPIFIVIRQKILSL